MPRIRQFKCRYVVKDYRGWVNQMLFDREIPHYQLAEYLGITPVTLSRKITGKTEFTLTEVVKIFEFFGMDLEESIYKPLRKKAYREQMETV